MIKVHKFPDDLPKFEKYVYSDKRYYQVIEVYDGAVLLFTETTEGSVGYRVGEDWFVTKND